MQSQLHENVPLLGGGAKASRQRYGDIDNEPERTRTSDDHGRCHGRGTNTGAGGGANGGCYRQSKRIWGRYQADGDAGLVQRLRGKPSARRKPAALREEVLALYGQERCADFGPTLMAGAQAQLQGDGAAGRLAPRLVRGSRPQVRADGG